MGKGTAGLSVHLSAGAYHFEATEKARAIKDSKGTAQGRLHLLKYDGPAGDDRFAVAAKKMDYKTDAEVKPLGWLDKKYYIIHKHTDETGTTTWYKINKNSLKKRLNLTSDDLSTDKKTGVATEKLGNAILERQNKLDIFLRKAKGSFQEQFIRDLFGRKGSLPYTNVLFFPVGNAESLYAYNEIDDNMKFFLENNAPRHTILIVSYSMTEARKDISSASIKENQTFYSLAGKPDSPFVIVNIGAAECRKINSGKSIPRSVLEELADRTT